MEEFEVRVAHRIGDKVWVEPIGLPGRVLAIYVSDAGTQYQTRYFTNGAPQTTYLFANELEKFREKGGKDGD